MRPLVLRLVLLCLTAPSLASAQGVPAVPPLDPIGQLRGWIESLGKPAQPAPPPDLGARDTFTINPFAFQHGLLGVEYERAFGTPLSLAIAPEFQWAQSRTAWSLAVGGTLSLRMFVLGNAPSGIYFGPEVSGLYLRTRQGDALYTTVGLGIGGGVGWTIVFFNRFTLSAGFAAHFRTVPDPDNGPDAVRSEILAIPRLNFGVAF